MLRIWLNALLAAPEGFVHCKTVEEAINLIKSGRVNYISLDSETDKESAVAKDIETRAQAWSKGDKEAGIQPLAWVLHGKYCDNMRVMRTALNRADEYWGKK